jgi:hypothetical protein
MAQTFSNLSFKLNQIDRMTKDILYVFLKVHLKICINQKFQSFGFMQIFKCTFENNRKKSQKAS